MREPLESHRVVFGQWSGRKPSRAAIIAAALVAVVVGGVLLTVGILVLLGFLVAGAAVASAWMLAHRARRLFRRATPAPRWPSSRARGEVDHPSASRLDPAQEIAVIEAPSERKDER